MATSTTSADYFTDARPAIRTLLPSSGLAGAAASPGSPRTPILGRSVSSQFGSPASFRTEQEDYIVYELGARHLSAGFAGESRPRCVIGFNLESGRRLGDYRAYDPSYRRKRRKFRNEEDWGKEFELYRIDLRTLDLGLVEDRLERALRTIHIDHLQLDQKPRKAVLAVPTLLPSPLLEVALKVLFNYSAQPPAVTILTTPLLACVGAGIRNALVVDIGWEEAVVTAVGEYKEIFQRRSIRAGKMLTREMAKVLKEEVKNQRHVDDAGGGSDVSEVSFEYAEEVTQRMGWCRARPESSPQVEQSGMVRLPSPDPDAESQSHIHMSFFRLSKPAESVLFTSSAMGGDDDHDLPIHPLAYGVLLALPLDLRAICISRIVITGGVSHLPGLKTRLLQELSHLVETRGWDPVNNYGSATAHRDKILRERSVNVPRNRQEAEPEVPLSPAKKPIQESIPHSQRIHDDKYDNITQKAEREASKGKTEMVKGVVRDVETLGAWAGASLVASLRVKGVHEVEREEFLKSGFSDGGSVM